MTEEPVMTYSVEHDPVAWKEFCSRFPGATIFQSKSFRDLFSQVPFYGAKSIVITRDSEVKALLVYCLIREQGWRRYLTNRCIITGGPLVMDNSKEDLSNILQALFTQPDLKHVIYTEVRNNWPIIPDRKTMASMGFTYTDHLNILIDLSQDENLLRQQLHPKRRANIRRARKKGVNIREIETAEDWQQGIDLVKKTYRRVNLPSPPTELFLKLRETGAELSRGFAAFHESRMIAVRFYLVSGNIIYDWYAGSDARFHTLHPNDILPWEVMKWAKKNGFKTYDFGGAGKPGVAYGVRTYKERFGGQRVNPGRFIKIHKPLLYKLGALGIRFYKYLRQS